MINFDQEIRNSKRAMRKIWMLVILLMSWQGWAAIPATPVMTLYQFNGDLKIPYYRIDAFQRSGASSPAGILWQGTSLIPCLVIRNGRPLTDRKGTPYVGFEVVVNARTATRASTDTFKRAVKERQAMTVANHHCDASVKHVIGVRKLFALEKAPFFSSAPSAGAGKVVTQAQGEGAELKKGAFSSANSLRTPITCFTLASQW